MSERDERYGQESGTAAPDAAGPDTAGADYLHPEPRSPWEWAPAPATPAGSPAGQPAAAQVGPPAGETAGPAGRSGAAGEVAGRVGPPDAVRETAGVGEVAGLGGEPAPGGGWTGAGREMAAGEDAGPAAEGGAAEAPIEAARGGVRRDSEPAAPAGFVGADDSGYRAPIEAAGGVLGDEARFEPVRVPGPRSEVRAGAAAGAPAPRPEPADESSSAYAGGVPDPRVGMSGAPGWVGQPSPYGPAGYAPGEVTSPFSRPAGGYGPGAYAGGPGGPPYGPPPAGPGQAEPVRPRRLRSAVAIAGMAAVFGGLIGGGTVALAGRNDSSPVAASVSRTSATAPNAPASANGTVSGAAATISPSVVTLAVQGDNAAGTGSGIIVRADGYILTNDHVVSVAANGGSITATFAGGNTVAAKIVGRDASTDLAVVKVDGVSGLTAATFADSAKLTVGQTVVAVGSPLGLDHTVTSGIVSAVNRATRGGDDNQAVFDAVQTDAPINPGNSGGPLVDLSGHVVGINAEIATASSNSSRFPGQASQSGNIGIGFAIPSNVAADIADQLIANGTAQHAFLGVELASGTDTGSSTGGAKLSQVTAGGPGARAGLQANDVVTKLDGQLLETSDDLAAAVRTHKPGDQVTLTVLRGGKTTTVTATLGSDAKK
jgi:putative serine protease PepD